MKKWKGAMGKGKWQLNLDESPYRSRCVKGSIIQMQPPCVTEDNIMPIPAIVIENGLFLKA